MKSPEKFKRSENRNKGSKPRQLLNYFDQLSDFHDDYSSNSSHKFLYLFGMIYHTDSSENENGDYDEDNFNIDNDNLNHLKNSYFSHQK